MHPDASWLVRLQESNGKERVGAKHHVLPRFYMANFSNSMGKIGTIQRNSGKRNANVQPESFLVQKDFYTFWNLEMDADGSIEELITQIEGYASEAIRTSMSIFRQFPLRSDDCWAFSLFAALQVLRGNRMRRIIEILGDFHAKLQFQNVNPQNAAEFISSRGVEVSEKEISNLLEFKENMDQILLIPTTNDHLQFILNNLMKYAQEFLNRPISLFKFPTPCLITSDEPIFGSVGDRFISGSIKLAEEIYLPLSPTHLLVFGDPFQHTSFYAEIATGIFDVRRFNKFMIENCHEYAIFNPDYEYKGSKYVPTNKPLIEVSAGENLLPAGFIDNALERRPYSRFKRSEDR